MRATLNISIPEEMKQWVESEVERGGYGTASEYFRQLVREDQQRRVREAIDAKLLAALESGDPIEATPEWWNERRLELRRRIKAKRKGES